MAKIRKNQKRKRYQFNRNRKRMKKNQLPKIQCKVVNEEWDLKKSTVKNLKEMGLVFNVNDDIVLSGKTKTQEVKTVVLESLTNEANAPREKGYRIPRNQVEFLTFMLNKYGEDYKAMARDKGNHAQLTWKQLRSKVNVFKSIPEQYNAYKSSDKNPGPTSVTCSDEEW